MMQVTKKLLAPKIVLFAAVLYSIALTVIMLIPVNSGKTYDLPVDKVVHIGLNGLLAFLWLWFVNNKYLLTTKKVLFVFIACVSYGIIIEILQETITYSRSGDFWDVVANTIGCMIAVVVYYFFNRNLKSKSPN